MSSPVLRELTGRDQRQINGITRRLSVANDRQEFASLLIEEITRCLPGEMSGWGETTPDYTQFTGMAVSADYADATLQFVEPISQHLDTHPALDAVGWQGATTRPRRVSDFATTRQFFNTPLYQEAYRHLDADHQIAFSPGCFDGTGIVISLNRKRADYTDRDCQKFHLLGHRITHLLHDLTARTRIDRQLRALETRWPLAATGTDRLTARELQRIAALVQSTSPPEITITSPSSRDTERKALYTILDKLELESRNQLLALLRELQP